MDGLLLYIPPTVRCIFDEKLVEQVANEMNKSKEKLFLFTMLNVKSEVHCTAC